MIWNYFKIAWRNLWKDKTFSLLNLFGLSTAFGAAMLLGMYSLFQLSYDKFHQDNIYQIYSTDQTSKGPQAGTSREVPFADALQKEVPGIDKISRYASNKDLVIFQEKQLNLVSAYVDPDFFSIFNFPIIKGDRENPIADNSSIAITQEAAVKIFGSEDVIGKTVQILNEGKQTPHTISAIPEDFPEQSSINFDIAHNFKNLPDFVYADNIDAWDKSNHEEPQWPIQ